MDEKKTRITALDIRIVLAVAVCYLTSTALKQEGVVFVWGERQLDIIQGMTACAACLLCCQDTTAISWKSGINRIIITAIGGLTGVCAVLADQAVGNPWFMVVLVALGVLLTLFFCKAAKVPYINARIGALTFILVSCNLTGTTRILYDGFRLLSTMYGVLVTIAVTWLCTRLSAVRQSRAQ